MAKKVRVALLDCFELKVLIKYKGPVRLTVSGVVKVLKPVKRDSLEMIACPAEWTEQITDLQLSWLAQRMPDHIQQDLLLLKTVLLKPPAPFL